MRNQKGKSTSHPHAGEDSRTYSQEGRGGHDLLNDNDNNPGSKISSPAEARAADRSPELQNGPGERSADDALQTEISGAKEHQTEQSNARDK